jgi:tetratricopeptide (TPR) repeat protein
MFAISPAIVADQTSTAPARIGNSLVAVMRIWYTRLEDHADLIMRTLCLLIALLASVDALGQSTLGTPHSPPQGGMPAPGTPQASVEALKLIRAASQALQRNDLDAAGAILDAAKAVDPQQPWLWATYGYLELERYQVQTAIADFQKELSLHPHMYTVYGPMAEAQKMMNQRSAATQTLQHWATAQRDNPQPVSMLMAMLMEDEDPKAAIAVGETALARLPANRRNDDGLQLLLGQALMREGRKDEGDGILLMLLLSTRNPQTINASAYALADAGRELPLAESAIRTALRKMVEESRTWTLDMNAQTLLAKSNLLAATWDTLGWTLFREGNRSEAEDYVRAAWFNRQSPEVGEHMGEIAAASGNREAALRNYALALTAIPARETASSQRKKITARVEALRKGGTKPESGDWHKSLTQLRTISLGPAKGLDGAAEYRVLLGDGKVSKVAQIGTRQVPGGSERILRAELTGFWPTGSQAMLVRNGTLNCQAGNCEFVFAP